jgi:NifB/MoaA-like Fe-S oxidoreductase
VKKGDTLLVPDVVMREGDQVFLDNVTLQDLEEILEIEAVLIESTPKGLVDALTALG